MALTVIRFAHPAGKPGFVPLDNLHGVVHAPSINDDILQVWVALQEHGADGRFDELALIVRWRDDTDAWPEGTVRHGVGKAGTLPCPWPARFAPRGGWEFS